MIYMQEEEIIEFYDSKKDDVESFETEEGFTDDNGVSVNVWVCQEWFPKGTYSKRFAGFPMNRLLKMQMDYMVKNVVNDWDFTLLICGEGEVRVGKSTLGQQLATYWTYCLTKKLNIKLPHSVKENMVFTGADLISKGNKMGEKTLYASLIFDEAGADLESTKVLQNTTKAVKDYLRECGQYNMLNILILPEYFDLPKSVALSRSIALINVYWLPDQHGNFKRGYFKFYNKPDKKKLYIWGKKELNYSAWQETFYGKFPHFYTFNEEEYKECKREALKNRESTGEKQARNVSVLYACLKYFRFKLKLNYSEMTRMINEHNPVMQISNKFIYRFLERSSRTFKDELELDNEMSLELEEDLLDDDVDNDMEEE